MIDWPTFVFFIVMTVSFTLMLSGKIAGKVQIAASGVVLLLLGVLLMVSFQLGCAWQQKKTTRQYQFVPWEDKL
jgi:hypothetical protein